VHLRTHEQVEAFARWAVDTVDTVRVRLECADVVLCFARAFRNLVSLECTCDGMFTETEWMEPVTSLRTLSIAAHECIVLG
jgi:hypothetical protein